MKTDDSTYFEFPNDFAALAIPCQQPGCDKEASFLNAWTWTEYSSEHPLGTPCWYVKVVCDDNHFLTLRWDNINWLSDNDYNKLLFSVE